MIQNNLDAEVAERPEDPVVYGGIGRAARDWACFDKIPRRSRPPATTKPCWCSPAKRSACSQPSRRAARDCQIPTWSRTGRRGALQRARPQGPDDVRADDRRLVDLHRFARHRAGHLRNLCRNGPPALRRLAAGKWILTAGPAAAWRRQPLVASLAGACSLNIECRQSSIDFRLKTRYLDEQANDLDDALARINKVHRRRRGEIHRPVGNAAEILPELVRRGVRPTASPTRPAHDLVHGYPPQNMTVEQWPNRRPTRTR